MDKLGIWKGIISHCFLRGELCSTMHMAALVLNDDEFDDLTTFGLYHFYYMPVDVFMNMKSLS